MAAHNGGEQADLLIGDFGVIAMPVALTSPQNLGESIALRNTVNTLLASRRADP